MLFAISWLFSLIFEYFLAEKPKYKEANPKINDDINVINSLLFMKLIINFITLPALSKQVNIRK